MTKFAGKTALITGSGTGIGLAIAKKFVTNGASVIILGRRKEPLEKAAEDLRSMMQKGSDAGVRIFPGVDVADESSVNAMFDQIVSEDITVDYMINNAGVSGPVTCFSNASIDDFRSTIRIHLTGTFWGSVQALRAMKQGGKIITISTFFTEERPLEQRPYRFRSPYTASQGAKNRLAELMSWELAGDKIVSIATNPGPVHSDRIYKTVYPKAAAEFMRVSGYEDMDPAEVEATAANVLLPLLGEDEKIVSDGINSAAQAMSHDKGITEDAAAKTLSGLLEKIRHIAEKVQKNTSRMIANQEFLAQDQVAESVLNLCDDCMSAILDGKVVPGDRVFYPVKPHVSGALPAPAQAPNLEGKGIVVITADPADDDDVQKIGHMICHIERDCGGSVVCFVSASAPKEMAESIARMAHSHVIDLSNPQEVSKWFETAQQKRGKIICLMHYTGKTSAQIPKMTQITRAQWDEMTEKFIIRPAIAAQNALEMFVPGGGKDPRLYRNSSSNNNKNASRAIMIIGPELPPGKKTTNIQRAQAEVFRGALRPFTTTVNQELSDVLGSNIRLFTALPGSVTGSEPDPQNVANLFDNVITAPTSAFDKLSTVIFCTDESR